MAELSLPLLYVLYALNFVFMVLMVVDFFLLSFSDPSDPHLKQQSCPP